MSPMRHPDQSRVDLRAVGGGCRGRPIRETVHQGAATLGRTTRKHDRAAAFGARPLLERGGMGTAVGGAARAPRGGSAPGETRIRAVGRSGFFGLVDPSTRRPGTSPPAIAPAEG